MDEFRKRFWDTYVQMQEDFDRFFDHYAQAKQPSMLAYRTRWSPPCNVYAVEHEVRVLVEIAGIRRDQLDLRVEADRVILRGTRPQPEAVRGHYYQMEIAFGDFELEVALPVPVDAEAVQAWYQDGFLHIVLPKIAEPRPRRITLSVHEQK